MAALELITGPLEAALRGLTDARGRAPAGAHVWGHDADEVVKERHWYIWPRGEDGEVGSTVGGENATGRYREVNVFILTYAVADTTGGTTKLKAEASDMLQAAKDHFARTRNAGDGNVITSIQVIAQGGVLDLDGPLWAASQLELTVTRWV